MRRNPEEIARVLRNAETIAICSHVNPDGDTLGAAAAMKIALNKLGKTVSLFCDGKVPDQLSFLPGIDEMQEPGENTGVFDLMLSVDVSDEKRLGACIKLKEKSKHTAQIDHHPTNPLFMEVNSVDGECPATCLLIREQIAALGIEPDRDIAICLYTGISTDTGNFAYDSTNEACFTLMSELMSLDLPLAELNRILFRDRAKSQVMLISKALDSLRYYEQDRIAVMKLTKEDFLTCGALNEHADTLVNFGLDTVGTCMAMLAREDVNAPGIIKFSLRAKEPIVINDVAQSFGGGGHPQAAGISMYGNLDEKISEVLEAMIYKLNG